MTIQLLKDGKVISAQQISADSEWKFSFGDLAKNEEGKGIQYTVSEETIPEDYRADVNGFTITNTLKCRISYDPNGGIINGSAGIITETHDAGEEITIMEAPVRSGYIFQYWKGSEYYPGDSYKVTGDHVFIAQWEKEEEPSPYTYGFTFTKKWSGGRGDSIDWTLYRRDGTVAHKKFNKKIVSDSEWRYSAWFTSDEDYYIIENVPAGYKVRYENTGVHADVTDRCYNGGTIINYKIPKTGDNSTNSVLWIGCVLLGLSIAGSTLMIRKRSRRRGRL